MFLYTRTKILLTIVAIVLAALVLRLFYIQAVSGYNLSARAQENRTITQKVPATRGLIYDRNYHVLVTNKPYMKLYAYPDQIANKQSTAVQLSPYLKETPAKVLDILDSNKYFVNLDDNLSYPLAQKLEGLKLTGVYFQTMEGCAYTQGSLAAQVLGFTGQGNQGLAGLEDQYDTVLAGRPGFEAVQLDGRGRPILSTQRVYLAPRPGDNLVLTIDENIQFYAQRELKRLQSKFHPDWATIIVMNPTTGGILALADTPSFDPANWSSCSEKVWDSDPAVLNAVEPGSVFKVVTAAAALEQGIASPATRYSFPGYISVSGTRIWDWNFSKDRDRTLTWAMEDSYNPVFADLAIKLGAQTFYRYVYGFGFGQPTGIDLPGEAAGLLLPVSRVVPLDLATMGFGQGIAVTPLQMITAASALANGGFLPVPHLVREITGPGNHVVRKFSPAPVRQVVSALTASEVMQMLRETVKLGTGQAASVPGYRIAGKTGTAQVPGPGGYEKGVFISSFLGFAPYPQPKISVLIMVDDPKGGKYYGDEVADPAFKRLADHILTYLRIPPDKDLVPPQKRVRSQAVTPVTVPDLRGYPSEWAQKLLRSRGLGFVLSGSGGVVESQTPSPQASVAPGAQVHLELDAPTSGAGVLLPDLVGLPIKSAGLVLARLGVRLDPIGSGLVYKQSPAADSIVQPDTTVKAWFRASQPWLN